MALSVKKSSQVAFFVFKSPQYLGDSSVRKFVRLVIDSQLSGGWDGRGGLGGLAGGEGGGSQKKKSEA